MMTKQDKLNIQLWIATLLVLSGIVLLFWGFLVKPLGEIHNSVLIAFGEMSTFAGALFGVDYTYKYKHYIHKMNEKNDGEESTRSEDE